jgi:hypothetical protein
MMVKSLNRLLAGTFLVLAALPALSAPTKEELSSLPHRDAVVLSSTYVEIGVASTGNVTMGTLIGDPNNPNDDNKRLLYGHPNSTTGYTTLRVDGADFANNSGLTLVDGPTTAGDVNTTVWENAGVRLTQRLRIVTGTTTGRADTMAIEDTYENIDSAAHDVGLRIFLDTQLGSNDGSPFQIPGIGGVTTETELFGAAIPQSFQVFDDLANPEIIALGTLSGGSATPPDRAIWGSWPSMVGNIYDYTIDPTRSLTGDSAIAYYWNPITLQPGQTRTIITYYGLGSVTTSTGPLVLGLTAPSQLDIIGGTYSPNPFTVSGFIDNSISGTPDAQDVMAELILPAGLELVAGQTNPQNLGTLGFGQNTSVNWQVRATGSPTGNLTMTLRVTTSNLTPGIQTVTRDILIPVLGAGNPVITEIRDAGNGNLFLRWNFTGPEPVLIYGVALFDWATGTEHYLDLGGQAGDPWLVTGNTEATIPVPGGGYYTAFVAAVVEETASDEVDAQSATQTRVDISQPAQALIIFQPGTPVDAPPNPAAASNGPGSLTASWDLQRALALVAVVVFDFQTNDFMRDPSYIDEVFRTVEIWPGAQPFGAHPMSVDYNGLGPGLYGIKIYHLGWDGSVTDSSAAAQSAGNPDGYFRVQVN